MNNYNAQSVAAKIALEQAFIAQCDLHPADLQQPNEGEGFWLEVAQKEFADWLAA